MPGETIRANLKGPAKVGSRWLKAGPETVTAEELAVLKAEGLVGDPLPLGEFGEAPAVGMVTMTVAEFEAAVAAQAQAIADAVLTAALKEALADLNARAAALQEQLAAAEAERDALKLRVAEFEAAQTQPNTPPSEKVAKTAPKKGAAAATKG